MGAFVRNGRPGVHATLPNVREVEPVSSFRSRSYLGLVCVAKGRGTLGGRVVPSKRKIPGCSVATRPSGYYRLPKLGSTVVVFRRCNCVNGGMTPFSPAVGVSVGDAIGGGVGGGFSNASSTTGRPGVFIFGHEMPCLAVGRFAGCLGSG